MLPCLGELASILAGRSLAEIPVFRAASLKTAPGGGSWRFDNLVGILAEISEEAPSGAVSFVAEIIAEAQGQNEPVAWVAGRTPSSFPLTSAHGASISPPSRSSVLAEKPTP